MTHGHRHHRAPRQARTERNGPDTTTPLLPDYLTDPTDWVLPDIARAILALPTKAMRQMAAIIMAERGEPAARKFCRKFGTRGQSAT